MIPLEKRRTVIHRFSQLMAMAVSARINLDVITEIIAESRLSQDLTRGIYTELEGKAASELFAELFPIAQTPPELTSYTDAYWCGTAYLHLFMEFRKPLPYLFLVMPLPLMLNLYPVYHQMDITQLFERYQQEATSTTILTRLLRARRMSTRDLSARTGISSNTISHYRKSDENLFRAGFQQAYRIALALNVSPDVMLQEAFSSTEAF